jgi:hypothetical protein
MLLRPAIRLGLNIADIAYWLGGNLDCNLLRILNLCGVTFQSYVGKTYPYRHP